ncbi:active regulator of SIRT1 [Agrilus planipennis]|uniref:Active regulator of SIRT1 n=1 Tax=Agrilus planipennis TaxID=224129 RepID=A0A1W4XJ00_AGRPL|nr:active regulator of SIRT1 [Agrilus planipennis]
MSAALVRKSLEIVDPELKIFKGKKKKKEVEVPQNFKVTKKISHSKNKVSQVNVLQQNRKLTVAEAKKSKRSEDQILKENLRKLKAIRESCKLNLNKNIVEKIIERAVTKRPVKIKKKSKEKKTAFTEEDFAKFEEEFIDN